MSKIQIFIATYNRPTMVINAINSAIDQNFDSIEVIVSDNSTNDETEILISQIKNKRLSYKRRNPSLPPIDHLNAILKDVTADYFMIFHDDDVMCHNMIFELIKKLKSNKLAVAAGANAYVFVSNKLQKKLYQNDVGKDSLIKSRSDMARNYLIDKTVPLSSYLYNKKIASKISFEPRFGGKHADVSFLINVCNLGQVINVAEPLMNYYYHDGQDSLVFNYFDMSYLINNIVKTTSFTRKDKLVLKLRAKNLYSQTLSNITDSNFSIFGWRGKETIKIMFKVYPFSYFPKIVLKLIIRNLFN